MKTALSIAGSDSSGGAGIQADMKTMTMNGVYAMTAITALTAQNTTGVQGIYEVPADFLAAQIDSVFADIVPDAVKIGMIASPELVETIASKLTEYEAKNIVVDPVMVSTSGSALSKGSAVSRMKEVLFPLAAVITPNIPEAEALSGMAIRSADEMEKAAEKLGKEYGCAVLVKGGHAVKDASDVLWTGEGIVWFHGKHIDNPNTHGTGCTLSSAIAANLAKGYTLTDAIDRAKAYISGALGAMLDLGQGSGPLDHIFDLTGEYAKEAK
ncbi:MAG: bifunctional hydroxymethylpyrimidine kinase/phosphomethylpyrimidine kinase [Selenomonadales bacterium]|nr:bifunctional hydroxymethylpyrimidine kinase/phosphomethylpyrimidine kinase [Selenomonadales bacterium]